MEGTESRTLAAFIALGLARMPGCRFRLSSPISTERSCSTLAFEKALRMRMLEREFLFLTTFSLMFRCSRSFAMCDSLPFSNDP